MQIQLNYVDFDDPSVESRKCLEVCRKYGKPAIIMEPVKGGPLVNLPEEAQKVFDELGGGSNASYAIRFAASQEGVMMVLSGMGSMAMMEDNITFYHVWWMHSTFFSIYDKVMERLTHGFHLPWHAFLLTDRAMKFMIMDELIGVCFMLILDSAGFCLPPEILTLPTRCSVHPGETGYNIMSHFAHHLDARKQDSSITWASLPSGDRKSVRPKADAYTATWK